MANKEERKEGSRGPKATPKKKLMMKMTKTIKTIPKEKKENKDKPGTYKSRPKEIMSEGLGSVGRASGKAAMLPPNMASRDSIPLGTSPKTGTDWE